jgi:hypothetical protein
VIASFQLDLHFPDVRDIAKQLPGEGNTDDVQFTRKIQTILKKMEKSNIVKILPKTRPWELQRYALSSFKFQDSDKNIVIFATDQQIRQTQDALHSMLNERKSRATRSRSLKVRSGTLAFAVFASYAVTVWTILQPVVNPSVFVSAFSIAVLCSVALGKSFSQT